MKTRSGAETAEVQGWTAHPSIVSFATKPEDAGTAKNVLALGASGDELRFFVNGEQVWSGSREGLATDGIFGLRVNHGLNLHVTTIMATAQGALDSFKTPIHICDIIVTGSSRSAGPQGVAGLRAFLEKVKLEHERLLMADVPPPQDVLAEIETLERELEQAIASRTPVQPDTTVGTFH